MKTTQPHSKNLRLHRVSDRPDTFFVTKCIQPRTGVLSTELREVICSAVRHGVSAQRIAVGAFVVMPDHWHGLFGIREGWSLPSFMQALMSFIGAKTAPVLRASGCEWQDGYYETRIRSSKQFAYISDYIVWNPVRKGLVNKAEDWDASSLREPTLISNPWPWEFEKD